MFISTSAFVDKNETISARETTNDLIAIEIDGKITLYFSRENADKLYRQIEQAMWDESEHCDNLHKEIDKLESRVDELEELIENYGYDIPA
jgi:polyhydroxyalkanoate synthesis regulator phasin